MEDNRIIKELETIKRANFFNGLMASPRFWNDIQDYNFFKESFYNVLFHGFGIIPGVLDDYKVQRLKGSGGVVGLIVHPGAAIDSKGRTIFLYEPQALTLDIRKYKLPATVYITVKYKEVMEDYFQNDENPDYQGYMSKIETAKLEIVNTLDSRGDSIELGRVFLKEGEDDEVVTVSDAEDFSNPGVNTLDFRFVPWARTKKSGLSPYLKDFLVILLNKSRTVSQIAYDSLNLAGFRELQTVSLTARMLLQCGDVSFEDIVNIIYPLFDINNQIVQEILEYERIKGKRTLSTTENFEIIKRNVFDMGDQIKSFDQSYERLDIILKCLKQVTDGYQRLFVSQKITGTDLSLMSEDLSRILLLEDERFTMVDFIDLRDQESMDSHKFEFLECSDVQTSYLSFSYPDGTIVHDTVKRYLGGSVRFNVKNIIKKRELLIVRRSDVIRGNYRVNVDIGNSKQILKMDTPDSRYRWRNVSVKFHEDFIDKYSLTVTFSMLDEGRDNMGHIWIYQKI
jgi:hypothetical protein